PSSPFPYTTLFRSFQYMFFHIFQILFFCLAAKFPGPEQSSHSHRQKDLRFFIDLCQIKHPVISLVIHFLFQKALAVFVAAAMIMGLQDPGRSVLHSFLIIFREDQLCSLPAVPKPDGNIDFMESFTDHIPDTGGPSRFHKHMKFPQGSAAGKRTAPNSFHRICHFQSHQIPASVKSIISRLPDPVGDPDLLDLLKFPLLLFAPAFLPWRPGVRGQGNPVLFLLTHMYPVLYLILTPIPVPDCPFLPSRYSL